MDGLDFNSDYSNMLAASQQEEHIENIGEPENAADVPPTEPNAAGQEPNANEPQGAEPSSRFFDLGDDFRAPESFENPEDELNWYKQKYETVYNNFTSEDFYQKIVDNYKEVILSKAEEAEKIKETYTALQKNPKEYIRQFFPESLAEIGVSPVMDDNEMSMTVDKKLKEEFGENYADMYNVNDLAPFKGNTFSRQVQSRGDAIYAELQKQNEKNRTIFENYTKNIVDGREPASEERIKNYVESQYVEFEKSGMDRADYDTFVSELSGYVPTMKDVYLMKNLPVVHQIGYDEGYEAAKKEFTKNVGRIATKVTAPQTVKGTTGDARAYEDFISKATKNGYLPINY